MGKSVDAVALLNSLDKEELAQQIEQAEGKVAEATKELRALQSMERIRKIRAGETFRKSPTKRKNKPAEPDSSDGQIKDQVIRYLRATGTSKPSTIAASLGVDPTILLGILADRETFIRKSLSPGVSGVALK